MQKGLGIAALVVAILAMFVPFYGSWLTILTAVLAALAYGPGLGLGIATIVVNVVHLFFFSPLLWATRGLASWGAAQGESVSDAHTLMALPWLLLAIQAVAAVVLFVLNSRNNRAVEPQVAGK